MNESNFEKKNNKFMVHFKNLIVLLFFIFCGKLLSAQSVYFYTNNSTYSNCRYHEVEFINTTTFSATECNYFIWNFGDGDSTVTTDPAGSVKHIFKKQGEFKVTLTGYYKNTLNKLTFKDKFVYYNSFYIGRSLQVKDSVCPNEELRMSMYLGQTSFPTKYFFGNGKTASESRGYDVNTSYDTPGTYSIMVVFENGACKGIIDTVYKKIVVTKALYPTPSFSLDKSTFCLGEPIRFNAGYHPSEKYEWNVGNGKVLTGYSVNYIYRVNYSGNVTLTATNLCGNKKSISKPIIVNSSSKIFGSNISLSINGKYSDENNFCVNEPIKGSFYDAVKDVKWNYGDGSTPLKGKEASYVYTKTGTYTFQATFTNFCGIDTIITKTINIKSAMPFKDGEYYIPKLSEFKACPNQLIYFNKNQIYGKQDDKIASYTWSLPNNQTINGEISKSFSLGEYPVSVTLKNFCGNDTTLTSKIYIKPSLFINPDVGFDVYDTLVVCPNEPFYLRYRKSESIKDYTIIGSGLVSEDKEYGSADFKFALPGIYPIKLKAVNYCGKDTTFTRIIQVRSNLPVRDDYRFYSDYSVETYCPWEPVIIDLQTDKSILKQERFYGDGTSKVTGESSYIYAKAGIYDYKIKLTNYCGAEATYAVKVSVSGNSKIDPSLFIRTNRESNCPNDQVYFSIEGNSVKRSGGIKKVKWNFGDGSSIENSSSYTEHIYSKAGVYTVKAFSENYCGDTMTIFKEVNINSNLLIDPYDVYLYLPKAICPKDELELESSSFNKTMYDYGDKVVTDKNYHVFANPGVYTVKKTVTNGCGNSYTKSGTIEVRTGADILPSVYINSDNDQVCPNQYVQFYLWSNIRNASFTFDFDDNGNNSYVEKLKDELGRSFMLFHKYSSQGLKQVKVTAKNGCGNITTSTQQINISSEKGGAIIDDLGAGVIVDGKEKQATTLDSVIFFAEGGAKTFKWNFGDNTTLTSDIGIVKHKYATPGLKNVSVFAETGCGDTITLFTQINVEEGKSTSGIVSLSTPKLTVYPNPTFGEITLINAPLGNYSIINEIGAVVYQFEVKELVNQTIQLDQFTKGVYFLKSNQGVSIQEKIVLLD